MREILFKGKRIDNGKWVEGYYTEYNGKTFIGINISIYSDIFEVFCTPLIRWFEVAPETLCQFTGLYDKCGNKIWENDILMANLDESYPEDVTYITVKWNFAGFVAYEAGTDGEYLDEFDLEHFEAVGNIFDNKELLQEESDE